MTTPPSGYQPSQDPYQQPGYGSYQPPAQDPYQQPQPPAQPAQDPYSLPPQPGHVYGAPYQASPYPPPPTQEQLAYQPYGQPNPYGQPAPYGAPYGQPQPRPGTNGFAIAALIFSFCGGLLAIVFGIVALVQIKKSGQGGKGLAIAALCISGLWLAAAGALVVVGILAEPERSPTGTITTEGNISVTELKTGDCIKSLKESSAVFTVPVVPCTQSHEGEVVGEFTLTGSSYPGEAVIDQQAVDKCDAIMTEYTMPATLEEVEDLFYIYPRSSDWSKGSRTVTCIAVTAPRSGSVKG